MEGFAGFVGLMFGLVVLSVIITLVVCAVKRHRREWLQDGQRRVSFCFVKLLELPERFFRSGSRFFVRFVSGRFGWSEHSEGRTPYRFVVTRAFVCNSGSVSGAQENRPPDRRVSLPERETLFFGGWPDCGVCVGSIRPRSRCSGFAITVRGVCGRGIAAVSDAVYSRAAIRSGCNRRFLSLYEY